MKQNIFGGTHHHHYNLTQQELELQSKTTRTFRISPKLDDHLNELAKQKGITVSKYIEIIIHKFLKSEQKMKELYMVLDDLIIKNF